MHVHVHVHVHAHAHALVKSDTVSENSEGEKPPWCLVLAYLHVHVCESYN